jgi:hypothetical protein
MAGIEIGAWLPVGWQVDTTGGLMMVEHMGTLAGSETEMGITVRIFVPESAVLTNMRSEHENLAYAVLEYVAMSPELMGGARTTVPTPFVWNEHHAAYYLFDAPDAVQGLVVALALVDSGKIVVVNITAPHSEAGRLRTVVPDLLGDLRVDRQRLNAEFLRHLPDPMIFPDDASSP